MGCPCDKILQVAEHWRVAGCSPGQSSLAAVPAGFCNIYAYVMYLLGLTPCALNGLPHHGIQEQSQKLDEWTSTFASGHNVKLRFGVPPSSQSPTSSI